MRAFLCSTMVILSVALVLGCSGSGGSGMAPELTQPTSPAVSGASAEPGAGRAPVLWGMWEISLNPLAGTAEVVPLRGVQLTVNVVNFLQPPAGKTGSLGVQIVDTSEWLTLGHLPVDVKLTHPFPGLPQYTGADVRGVFVTTGHKILSQDPNLAITDQGVSDPYLANADGYTRWMNPVEFVTDGTLWTFIPGALGSATGFDATLNGYKYFANGLGATDNLYAFFTNTGNLHNRGQFLSGTQNARRYDMYFPLTGPGGSPDLKFQYAVLASWEPATDLDPGDLPGSFPPAANAAESFLVSAGDGESTLYYTPGDAGGDLKMDVEIFNWAPHLGASPSVLDGIEKVIIESPQGILPSPFVEFGNAALAATAVPGTTDASSIVTVEIDDCIPKDVMGQQVIITVQQKNLIYDNGGLGSSYSEAPLSAYFFTTLDISNIAPQHNLPEVHAIDPDHGIPDTYMYDVVVTGVNLGGITEVSLVGDAEQTTVKNFQVVDAQHLACELDLHGLSIGLYDVVAHDPVLGDASLVDGFELMDCPSGIHQSLQILNTNLQFDPLFVAGVFTSGPYAGQIITQAGSYAWNRIDVGDPPVDFMPVIFFASKPSLSGVYTDWSWSLDTDPLNQIFAFSTFDDDDDSGTWPDTQFDFVKVCKQSDGSYLGACDTNCGYAVGQVDVDERGNIWAVCANAYYPSMAWTVQRWNYDASAPAPHYTKVGDYDMSAYIGGDRVVSDIVVLQRYRRMYISMSNGWSPWGVRIMAFDISGPTPVFLNSVLATANGFYGTDSYQEVHQRFVDMEVDRRDDVLAGCRIMVMFMGQGATNRTLELRKYDLDLNLINSAAHEFYWDCPGVGAGWFSNFVLDDQHGGRVVAIYDRFTLVGPGYVGVAPAPPDW